MMSVESGRLEEIVTVRCHCHWDTEEYGLVHAWVTVSRHDVDLCEVLARWC